MARRCDRSLRSALTIHREPHPNLREPYFGTAEIALDSLGAYTNGTLSSLDPERPGIAVRE
jgi:hypothetical protein